MHVLLLPTAGGMAAPSLSADYACVNYAAGDTWTIDHCECAWGRPHGSHTTEYSSLNLPAQLEALVRVGLAACTGRYPHVEPKRRPSPFAYHV